jgi:hypothetical protein
MSKMLEALLSYKRRPYEHLRSKWRDHWVILYFCKPPEKLKVFEHVGFSPVEGWQIKPHHSKRKFVLLNGSLVVFEGNLQDCQDRFEVITHLTWVRDVRKFYRRRYEMMSAVRNAVLANEDVETLELYSRMSIQTAARGIL